MLRFLAFLPLFLLYPAGSGWGQSLETVVQFLDDLPNGARVFDVDNQWVRDDGIWYVRGKTWFVDDFYALESGANIPPQGPLPTWRFDRAGNRLQEVDDVLPGQNGLFWNATELLRELTFLDLPGLPENTFLFKFLGFYLDGGNRILAQVKLQNPPSPRDGALLQLEVDADGDLVDFEVLIRRGHLLPATGDVFAGFGDRGPHRLSFNQNGQYLWSGLSDSGFAFLMLGLDEVVARTGMGFSSTGDPALDGRRIRSFQDHELDLNDFGEHV